MPLQHGPGGAGIPVVSQSEETQKGFSDGVFGNVLDGQPFGPLIQTYDGTDNDA